jgi:tetratricopeptide (TPR) repeat protein
MATLSPGDSNQAVAHRRLSVAMVVRDAADLIVGSLASIRDVADEIVVVDTGSKDQTRDIALARASRVLDFEWCDNFAAARNFCLSQVTGDWILWLDAGEVMTPDAAAKLRGLVDAQSDVERAYLVMVRMPPNKSDGAAEQIGRIRLHPRCTPIEFSGRVREEIQTAIEALGMSIELAPFTIERSRREHDSRVKRQRAERNIHLAALEIQEHGVSASPLLAMADACMTLGKISEGIEFFSKAMSLAQRGSTTMLEAFYGVLAGLDQVTQARDKQIALCHEALTIFPFDAQLLCAMASYLERQGRIDLAQRAFETAAHHGEVDPQTWHLVEIGEIAEVCNATCQDLLGDSDAARRTLEAAIQRKPTSQRLQRQLLEFYIRRDHRKEALDLADRFSRSGSREALRSAVRGACLAAKQNWVPALAYLQTALGAGCRDVICWRALMTAHLATGDIVSAARTLARWQTEQPDSSEVARFSGELERLRSAESESEPRATDILNRERGRPEMLADTNHVFRVDVPRLAPSPPTALPGGISIMHSRQG